MNALKVKWPAAQSPDTATDSSGATVWRISWWIRWHCWISPKVGAKSTSQPEAHLHPCTKVEQQAKASLSKNLDRSRHDSIIATKSDPDRGSLLAPSHLPSKPGDLSLISEGKCLRKNTFVTKKNNIVQREKKSYQLLMSWWWCFWLWGR